MIKLVAVDMDGTLLTEDKQITPASREAIRRLQEAGGEFVICSGRDYKSASSLVKAAGLTCGYICDSGAMVHEPDGTVVEECPMEPEGLKRVLHHMEQGGVIAQMRTADGVYVTGTMEEAAKYFREELPLILSDGKWTQEAAAICEELFAKIRCVGDLDRFVEEGPPVYKLFGSILDVERLWKVKDACRQVEGLAVASSYLTNIEITHIHAQKGPALRRYARRRGIPDSQVMAIGDSENDSSMLSMDFGYTVAMANGEEEIKQMARYLTASNQEDGVALAIRRLVFGEESC